MKQKKSLRRRLFAASLCSKILFFNALLIAPIYEIDHMHEIAPYITGPHTLVLFDIDNTLIETDNEIASPEWFSYMLNKYKEQGLSQSEAVERILPEHLAAHKTTGVRAIEQDTLNLINKLHKEGIYPIALTARSYIDITRRQLKTARIDLKQLGRLDNICYVFNEFEKPAYYTPGILFANGNDKGAVLEAFLNKLKYRPRKIVFVDDQRKHVVSVEKMAQRLGIKRNNFIGVRYGKLDSKVEAFNQKMATVSTS